MRIEGKWRLILLIYNRLTGKTLFFNHANIIYKINFYINSAGKFCTVCTFAIISIRVRTLLTKM
jgi:hypothetical protein